MNSLGNVVFGPHIYHMDRQGQRHGLSEVPHAHLNYEQYGNSE